MAKPVNKEFKQCPNCGSLHTNEVSWSKRYCFDCDVEFSQSGKISDCE